MYTHLLSFQIINRDKRKDSCFNSSSNEKDLGALRLQLTKSQV